MKKSTKRILLSLVVILTMIFSVFSYAFLNIFSFQTGGVKPITSYILNENLSDETRQFYIQNGITFLEIHYDESKKELVKSIEELPNNLTTPYGEIQLIVIEVYDPENTFGIAESINGIENFNLTNITYITERLCNILFYPSVGCLPPPTSLPNLTTTTEI